ncbi:MAG: transcriptional regulator FtsR, partial [Nitriliruptorales bacterium]
MRTFTIGEVLNQLRDEFEDVTISKIRFLESEGLIQPDRTESGYRKFTDDDIERLRYVLRSQRDRYLPLKVIREELDRIDAGEPVAPPPPLEPPGAPERTEPESAEPAAQPVATKEPADLRLSLQELCEATGLEAASVRALRDHGLLRGESTFDADDLAAARSASRLMALGLEPRHLRMYIQFADRELALYEQLVAPLLRQRNPDSRQAATEQLDELAQHGAQLHRALLGRHLRTLVRR